MGLDIIEIVMGWEEAFGISFSDEEVTMARTPRMAIDLIARKLGVSENTQSPCLTFRSFHRLRRGIATSAGVSRSFIRPESPLRDLVRKDRRKTWTMVREVSGLPSLPSPRFGIGIWFTPITMADLSLRVVARAAKDLKNPNAPWSRSQIRDVVRAVVTDVSGKRDYSDDDDFFKDIGLG